MIYTSNIAGLVPIIREYASYARNILELGCEYGTGSTRAIEEGVGGRQDVVWRSVDLEDKIKPEHRPKHDGWGFVKGDSRATETVIRVMSSMPEDRWVEGFDLIFIDTQHDYHHMRTELETWSVEASDTCRWLFHDTWMNGRYNTMTDAIKEFAEKHAYRWIYTDLSMAWNGLGALLPTRMEVLKSWVPKAGEIGPLVCALERATA